MPYASEWLTFILNRISGVMGVSCSQNSVALHFDLGDIVYEKSLNSTTVECKELNKWSMVELGMKTVFAEDFKEIFNNHVGNTLHTFGITARDKDCYSEVFEPTLIQCLENVEKPKIFKVLSFTSLNIKQGVKLARLVDSNRLLRIAWKFSKDDEISIKTEDILSLKNRDLDISFSFHELSMENALEIKKLLSHSEMLKKVEIVCQYSLDPQLFAPFLAKSFTRNDEFQYIFKLVTPKDDRIENDQAEKEQVENLETANWLQVFALRDYMDIIMTDLNFFDIEILRKTSKDIRSCIDNIKPNPSIDSFTIGKMCGLISAVVQLENKEYRRNMYETGEIFKNDFKTCFDHQKSCLKELKLLGLESQALKLILHIFEQRNVPLPVETLKIMLSPFGTLLLKALHYVSADALRDIHIFRESTYDLLPGFGFEPVFDLDLGEICTLNQWKNADKIHIEEFIVSTPIQQLNLDTFSIVDMTVKTISSDDIIFLKETLLKSSKLQKCKIVFKTNTIDATLYERLQEPHRHVPNLNTIWYFPIIGTQESVQIKYDVGKAVTFTRITSDRIG